MGTQNQTPGSQPQEKRPSGMASEHGHRDPKPGRDPKAKDAGNVPRSDDDVADESNQGSDNEANS